LHECVAIRVPLLASAVMLEISSGVEERLDLISNCLRANREQQIDRYPAYKVLTDMARCEQDNGDAAKYINTQFVVNILVWYHLALMGEAVKLTDPRLQRLICKANNFTLQELIEIVEINGEL